MADHLEAGVHARIREPATTHLDLASARKVGAEQATDAKIHRPGENQTMDERTEGQPRVIRKVIAVTQAADISVWLFGGWGLDARIGRL